VLNLVMFGERRYYDLWREFFCSNIVPMTIFHDSKFEVGMASRSRVMATYVILIDVYML